MTEFPSEFEKPFVGLGAAVAEKNFAGRQSLNDLLRQSSLRLVIIEVGDVNQLLGLLHEGVGDLRVRMAETTHGNPAAEIEVTFPAEIPHITAAAAAQGQIETSVAGDHELLEQSLDCCGVVTNDGRRKWNNFFHLL